MKNTIKNMLVAGILTSAFMVGATNVKAGLMMSDFAPTTPTGCSQSTFDTLVDFGAEAVSFAGILMSDRTGLLISDRAGILMGDRSGLLVSDRSGLLVSDRSGLMVSDRSAGCKE